MGATGSIKFNDDEVVKKGIAAADSMVNLGETLLHERRMRKRKNKK